MKAKIFLLIVFVLFSIYDNPIYAQAWTSQTSNTTQTLWDVYFINNTTGIIVGAGGTILKTTNSGINWISKSSGTTNILFGVKFINAMTGFSSGISGPLLKTTNAGESWFVISFGNLPTSKALGGSWFINENTGVIAMGQSVTYSSSMIIRTVNGGASWDTVYNPGSGTGWISYFHFSDDNNGYASVSGTTEYKTTNGGLNWSVITMPRNLWYSGVYFFNSNTGFIGGGQYNPYGGYNYKTINGGNTWSEVDMGYGFAKIQFINANNGISLAGVDTTGAGILRKTTNGGTEWNTIITPSPQLYGFHYVGTDLIYAVGVNGAINRYGYPIGIKKTSENVPDKFELQQNYPNPFNPTTKIKFDIPAGFPIKSFGNDNVVLKVFDALGRQVATLVNENFQAGTYEIKWDASAFSSGVYFYRLTAGDYTKAYRMILMK